MLQYNKARVKVIHLVCKNCENIINNHYEFIDDIVICFPCVSGIRGGGIGLKALDKIPEGAFLTGYNGKRIYLRDDKGSRYFNSINYQP